MIEHLADTSQQRTLAVSETGYAKLPYRSTVKLIKIKLKFLHGRTIYFPSLTFQYPLKNKEWHSSKPLTFPK